MVESGNLRRGVYGEARREGDEVGWSRVGSRMGTWKVPMSGFRLGHYGRVQSVLLILSWSMVMILVVRPRVLDGSLVKESKRGTRMASSPSPGMERVEENGDDMEEVGCPTARYYPSLVWLHIPKCGTSFSVALHSLLCDGFPKDHEMFRGKWDLVRNKGGFKQLGANASWCHQRMNSAIYRGGHAPINESTYFKAVALFRNPNARLLSAFHHDRHAYGMPRADRERMEMQQRTMQNESELRRFESFVTWPGIRGCQAKMLLGHHCATRRSLSQSDLTSAVRAVDRLAFVGLTELFNPSVCLLHCRLMGYDLKKELEMMNIRPGSYNENSSEIRLDDIGGTELEDLMDTNIFNAAVRRFQRDWNRMKVSSCLHQPRCQCMDGFDNEVQDWYREYQRTMALRRNMTG